MWDKLFFTSSLLNSPHSPGNTAYIKSHITKGITTRMKRLRKNVFVSVRKGIKR